MAEEQITALAPVVPAQQQATQLLNTIMQASRDPTVDAGKMKAMADLAMQLQDREAERRFRMAKHRALLEMPKITKRGAITNKNGQVQSRYSKFEDIHRIVTPILAEHKLIMSFNVGHEGQLVTVQPILAYSDGELAFEERGGEMVLAVDTTGSKNATQGAGSAASYGKRHSYKAMLNIVEDNEDDDGQQGAGAAGYEALPQAHKDLIDAARKAALGGAAEYEAYFKALSTGERGFLGFNYSENGETWHEQNKRAAAAVAGEKGGKATSPPPKSEIATDGPENGADGDDQSPPTLV
jgi:hypothetical protein